MNFKKLVKDYLHKIS